MKEREREGNDRTEGDSMWNKMRLIGLGGLGYTIGGDMMEVKGFMDWEFME
jgi:hypothetical protein